MDTYHWYGKNQYIQSDNDADQSEKWFVRAAHDRHATVTFKDNNDHEEEDNKNDDDIDDACDGDIDDDNDDEIEDHMVMMMMIIIIMMTMTTAPVSKLGHLTESSLHKAFKLLWQQ